MAEADTENRHAARELPYIVDGVGNGFGIAGTVRKKNAVRLERQNVLGGSLCRYNRPIAAVCHEKPKDVLLDAVVVCDHRVARVFFAVLLWSVFHRRREGIRA